MAATEVGSISYVLNLDKKDFDSGMKTASASFKDMGQAAGNLANAIGTTLQRSLLLAGAGLTALVLGIRSSVKSAEEAEFADVKMAQALRQTAHATDEQIQMMKDYANTLQFQIGVSDEVIKGGIAMLATFKLNTDQIKKTIPVLADMAAMYRKNTGEMVDYEQTAIMIGKATGGELYKNLQRVGVIFDDTQLKMLENADAAERLRIVTEELGNEFGGQALVQANTFAGKMTVLGLYIDEFKEKIGKAVIDGLTPFIKTIMDWANSDAGRKTIDDITKRIEELGKKMSEWVTNVAIPWIKEHWPEIKRVVGEVADKIWKVIEAIAGFIAKHPELSATLIAIGGALALLSFLQIPQLILAFANLGGAIGLIPSLITIGIIVDLTLLAQIKSQFEGLLSDLKGLQTVVQQLESANQQLEAKRAEADARGDTKRAERYQKLIDDNNKMIAENQRMTNLWAIAQDTIIQSNMIFVGGISLFFQGLYNQFAGFWGMVGNLMIGNMAGVRENFNQWLTGIKQMWKGALDATLGQLGSWVSGVLNFFIQLFAKLIGHSIIPDLVNGIINWIAQLPGRIGGALAGVGSALSQPFVDAFNRIIDWAKKAWEWIKKVNPFSKGSPSLVDLVQKGTAVISQKYGNMFSAISDAASFSVPEVRMAAIPAATEPVEATRPIQRIININPGMLIATPQEFRTLAEMLEVEFDRIDRAKGNI